jgi:hypothetical protein
MVIEQSGAGNALCSLSSTNTMAVAEHFTAVVIATDHDIGRNLTTGKLRSKAISRAVEASKETRFYLAVLPKISKSR